MLLTLLLTSLGSTALEPAVPHSNYLLALTPEESVSVLAIGNLDEMRASSRKNSYFRFAQDEEVVAFVDEIAGGAMEKLLAELQVEQVLGSDVDLEAFFASLHGSIVLFSQMPNQDPNNTMLGLMIELGDDRSGFDQVFSRLMERVANEVTISGSDHLGVPLMSLQPKEPGAEGVLHMAELGDAVILMGGASGPACMAELHKIIDRWAGTSATGGLLENERFKAGRQSLGFDPNIECHVDVQALWTSLRNSGELRHADLPEVLLDEIGQIQWFHGGARVGVGEELDFQLGLAMPQEGILASFAGLFGGVPVDLMSQVPRQSSSLSSLTIDLHGLFNRCLDLVRSFNEDEFQEVQRSMQGVADMGIDIEGDFLAQLTGGYVRFSVEVPAAESLLGMAGAMVGTANGDDPLPTYASATIIGLQDPSRVEAAVDKLIETFNQQKLTTELANGRQAHAINFGPAGIHWAFSPDSMIISMQPTPIAEALRMMSDDSLSIMDKGRFAELIQSNRKSLHLTICDTATNLKSILGGLQSTSRMLPMLSMMSDFKLPKEFPINARTAWPAPNIVGRYFEGTVSTAVTWDEISLRFRLSSK